MDSMFENTTYIDRFMILCQRLRQENIFNAVWFIVVNPETGNVYEPDSDLNYDSFVAEIKGKIGVCVGETHV